MRQEFYYAQVDPKTNDYSWTDCKYHKLTIEQMDDALEKWGNKILHIVGNGKEGVMAMWACFKNRINSGCYSDMINAYRLLTDDHKSLVDREHELRHAWNHYEELWQIRYYGSVENYLKEELERAKKYYQNYFKEK